MDALIFRNAPSAGVETTAGECPSLLAAMEAAAGKALRLLAAAETASGKNLKNFNKTNLTLHTILLSSDIRIGTSLYHN